MQVSITIDRALQQNDLQQDIELKRKVKVQNICIPVFNPRLPDDLTSNNDAVTRSDRIVGSFRDWNENFVGRMTYWIDLDSKDLLKCKTSKDRFTLELSYCSHLGLKKVILPPLMGTISQPSLCFNYGQMLMKYVNSSMNTLLKQQKLLIPLPFLILEEPYSEMMDKSVALSSWALWNKLQHHIDYCPSVGLLMEVTDAVDDFVKHFFYSDVAYLNTFFQRWLIEPLVSLQICFSSFIFNSHGFPVLPKHLQYLLQFFMKFSVGVVLVGNPSTLYEYHKQSLPANSSEDDSDRALYQPFVEYLRYLQKKTEDEMLNEDEKNCYSYFDVLQLPLQPLMDNLDSNTYEVFERDSVKYVKYEKAIEKALKQIVERKQLSNDSSEAVEVMVVGCGRGPLIVATLSASSYCNIPVKITGIEKNRNAIITLLNRMKMEYWDPNQVKIISNDMRRYYCEKKCDLIVSELLGSFGDNELSPECLYNCEHNFHQNTISIPTSYTSYLQPISSPLLYMAAREAFSHYPSTLSSSSPISTSVKGLETPFVVLMKRFLTLADPEPCWNFHHPSFCDPEKQLNSEKTQDSDVDTKR
jgi:protein arginine N-methyltransferase 5